MVATLVDDKRTVNIASASEPELSSPSVEVQSIRRLISAITGAAIQSLTEMTNSDYTIGVTMFKRWESAQSELEGIKGRSGLLEYSRNLKQDLEQVFARRDEKIERSERDDLYSRTKLLLEKLDCCLESLR